MLAEPLTEVRVHENEKQRRAFFVIGPEGSGTYMLTEALVAAGCHWEQWHESNIMGMDDNYNFGSMPSPFVFHRSLPHAGLIPNFSKIFLEMEKEFDYIHMLMILRDFNATTKSVMRRDSERTQWTCEGRQWGAIIKLGEILEDVALDEFTYITYEAFVHSEGFRRWLFGERLGLPYPEDYEVYDGNIKYYEENR